MTASNFRSNWLIGLLIGAVFALGLFMRFWKLSEYPVSLSIDEVAVGDNAYSILKTGKDEWGAFLPLTFKSVGDYKPPVDVYLTVSSIAIFGLNEFSVRFPVALIGSFTVLVFIFLLKELKFSWSASIFGGLWFAILPWHINFSRGSFEAITALFFLLLGLLSVLIWYRKNNPPVLIGAIIFLSLSVWSYHSERFFVPLLGIYLLFLFRKKKNSLLQNRKLFFTSIVALAIFALPFIYLTFFTQAVRTRALSTSIFRETNLARSLHNGNYKGIGDFLFNNDAYVITRHWAGKYINYYDPRFWFWKGMQFTPPGYPDLGLLYAVDLPIFLFGVYGLLKSKNKLLRQIALFWFLAGPLPASVTMNEQHPLRALTWVPFFGFVIASGFENICERVKKMWVLLFGIYGLAITVNVLLFFDVYFVQGPHFFSEFSQYGYKEIASYVCKNYNAYDKIVITDTFGSEGPLTTGIPYAYVLFYCHYDPAEFMKTRNIDKIVFRRPDWKNDSRVPLQLLIGSNWDFPLDKIPADKIIKKIYFLNGVKGFIFVRT